MAPIRPTGLQEEMKPGLGEIESLKRAESQPKGSDLETCRHLVCVKLEGVREYGVGQKV
jgi:hypothetical protein